MFGVLTNLSEKEFYSIQKKAKEYFEKMNSKRQFLNVKN